MDENNTRIKVIDNGVGVTIFYFNQQRLVYVEGVDLSYQEALELQAEIIRVLLTRDREND